MFKRKTQPGVPIGPDFSTVTAQSAVELVRRGQLEKLHLLPPSFGGADIPQNIVYVPVGFAAIKAGIDENVIRPLVLDQKVTSYTATPEYTGTSFIPIAITIVASDPGSFTTTINIWGPALGR